MSPSSPSSLFLQRFHFSMRGLLYIQSSKHMLKTFQMAFLWSLLNWIPSCSSAGYEHNCVCENAWAWVLHVPKREKNKISWIGTAYIYISSCNHSSCLFIYHSMISYYPRYLSYCFHLSHIYFILPFFWPYIQFHITI